jgi:hypothetical protein
MRFAGSFCGLDCQEFKAQGLAVFFYFREHSGPWREAAVEIVDFVCWLTPINTAVLAFK